MGWVYAHALSGSHALAAAVLEVGAPGVGRLRRALLLALLVVAPAALIITLYGASGAIGGGAVRQPLRVGVEAEAPAALQASAPAPARPAFAAWDEEAYQPVWHQDIGIGR